jgi:hypothetical protein
VQVIEQLIALAHKMREADRGGEALGLSESDVNNGDNKLTPGDVVFGLEASEFVEIQRLASFGNKPLVEGVGLTSGWLIRRPLSEDELAFLLKVRSRERTFDGRPELFLLGAEAACIRIAHRFDLLFAVNPSIVDPLPHRVEAEPKPILLRSLDN